MESVPLDALPPSMPGRASGARRASQGVVAADVGPDRSCLRWSRDSRLHPRRGGGGAPGSCGLAVRRPVRRICQWGTMTLSRSPARLRRDRNDGWRGVSPICVYRGGHGWESPDSTWVASEIPSLFRISTPGHSRRRRLGRQARAGPRECSGTDHEVPPWRKSGHRGPASPDLAPRAADQDRVRTLIQSRRHSPIRRRPGHLVASRCEAAGSSSSRSLSVNDTCSSSPSSST